MQATSNLSTWPSPAPAIWLPWGQDHSDKTKAMFLSVFKTYFILFYNLNWRNTEKGFRRPL